MNKFTRNTVCAAMLAGTALVGVSTTANAAGFAVREQSAEGQGASFAGIAAGGADLSSMFFNPATITLHDGIQVEGDGALILPYSKAKNGASIPGGLGGPSSGNIGKFAFVPSNYGSYQVNENLYVGFMAGAPFGLITKGNATWAGSFHGIKSDLFMIQAGPVVGYKINDMISLAASVRGVYSDVTLTQNAGPFGLGKLKGDDWGINYALGILLRPTDGTTIGIGYNSQTKLRYTGTLSISANPLATQQVAAKLTTPGTLNVGVKQKLGEDFTVMLGFEWAQWSKLKRLAPINRTTGLPATAPTPFNWKDSYFYSIGGEYKFSDMTTLRAGFAYEDTSVPAATRGVRIPDANRYWLSIGASHKINENLRASFGYSHIISNNGKVALAPSIGLPGLTATFKQHVDIISVSGTYTFN